MYILEKVMFFFVRNVATITISILMSSITLKGDCKIFKSISSL